MRSQDNSKRPTEIPREAEAKSFDFDSMPWIDEYDHVVESGLDIFSRYDDILEAVSEIACPSPGLIVLDIGAGTGNLTFRCLTRGASVVGLDPSEKMLAKARAKAESAYLENKGCRETRFGSEAHQPTIEFRLSENPFLEIPYPDSTFDAVVGTYAFHHIPHWQQPEGIREMVRVLRPGGVWAIGEVAFKNAAAELEAKRTFPWLDEDEYYPHIDSLRSSFSQFHMILHSKQFTPVAWVLWALKPTVDGGPGW